MQCGRSSAFTPDVNIPFRIGALALLACVRSPASPLPTEILATFNVEGEIFHAWISNSGAIVQAISLWQGTSAATIPNGQLVFAPVAWNAPWSWYLDPASIRFAQLTLEQCDGRPSYVETSGPAFGPVYCPWSAVMTGLEDQNGIPLSRTPSSDAPEPSTPGLIGFPLFWYFAFRARARRR